MPTLRRSKENPAQPNTIADHLQAYRLEHSYTYRQLAILIGGIDPGTVRYICLGRPVTIRIAAKVERFLAQADGDHRAP